MIEIEKCSSSNQKQTIRVIYINFDWFSDYNLVIILVIKSGIVFKKYLQWIEY